MLFSSMIFLWVFLSVVLSVNYLLNLVPIEYNKRIKIKNIFLLISSLFFYGYGNIKYLFLMIFSILINYIGGILVSKENKLKKINLIIIITINILLLFYFKYFNMLIIIIEQLISNSDTLLFDLINMKGTGKLGFTEVVLPIGISFFTFQAMSYVIDVYRNDAKKQNNILDFALYVSLFPQLIAGPIVKYSDVSEQINFRIENEKRFAQGEKRFIYGLAKKVILANAFAKIVDEIWTLDISNIGIVIAVFGAFCYTMQIYYDFSGYSDMAIGLGRIFGFKFKENFNYPYMSLSITEFWRRWHISLSNWFKNYVYIPLGGNRKGKIRTYINLFIVFLLTGIWHGANFTFITWGLIYGIILVIERLFLLKLLDKNPIKIINIVYTLVIVNVLWIFFRAPNLIAAVNYIKQFNNFKSNYSILSYLSMNIIICSIFGILCMGLLQKIFNKFYIKYIKTYNSRIIFTLDMIIQIFLLIYCIMLLANSTYNPFIYFQF